MNQIQQEVAKTLLNVGCVTLSPQKLFTWASGIQSPIYCDNRLLMSHIDGRRFIREAFIQTMKEKNIECGLIAAVATGAVPHGAWLAERLNKPFAYIRSENKEHGKQNQVEGKVEPGISAVVIEDLVSTGGSSIAAVEALRNAGAKVDVCLAIFSYGFPEAQKKFSEIDCELISLSNFSTLLQVAKEARIIKQDQLEMLQRFSADPWKWLER